ncbi:Zinc finger, CW-type [Phytophthora cactorum]|nr:Zinc finger, CW-type [Phytophthora cactorum]
MWSIRVRGPRGKQVVLKIDPEANFKTFSGPWLRAWVLVSPLCLARSEGIEVEGKRLAYFSQRFPASTSGMDGSALVKYVFEANDTVVVDTSSGAAAPVLAASAASSAAKKPAARPKRAAAKKTAAKAPRSGVHTLNPPTSAKKKAPPKRKITGSGHQLGSSLENDPSEAAEVTGDGEGEPQRKYRRSKAINLTSKEDVEISLVNAVSGQSHGRAAKFFRAATKNAVEHQYEITLATSRLNAALAYNFKIEELSTIRRGDGSAAKLRVRFKETPRKWKEETVDLLKTDELQAILKYVLISGGETGREMLKPFNMAQVSTRVFWNIARVYDGDVAAGLADLVPDEDWSFLDTRTRVMSEKAMEAKVGVKTLPAASREAGKYPEQSLIFIETRGKKGANPARRSAAKETKPEVIAVDSSDEEETKQEPVEPKRPLVQTPAFSAKEATPSTLRSAAARAAVARPANPSSIKKESAVDDEDTESDEDVEEATTVYCDSCKKARILSSEEAANAELNKDPWTCANLAKAGRSGGCDAIDDEVAQITGAPIAEWLRKASVNTRLELADASVGATIHSLVSPLDPSAETLQGKLEKLIDEARLDEVNDWMEELVGEAEVVQQLEIQKLGTPADLIATPTDLILEAVGTAANVSLEVVSSWQTCAKALVDEHPWLAEWRTL